MSDTRHSQGRKPHLVGRCNGVCSLAQRSLAHMLQSKKQDRNVR